MKSKALSIVVLLLTVVLFGLLFVNHRQEQRQTAHMQQLQKEAMPYEQEINDIRLELVQKKRAINTKEDTSGILFGFVPASADDFIEIDKLAAEHSITPVILLDCSQEKEQLAQILEKAVAKDYEVVLAGLQIDESILQTADEMKDLLAQMDDTKRPAFLLRNKVNTEEARNLLNEHLSQIIQQSKGCCFVQCAGRLVQQKNWMVGIYRPGNGDALHLPFGQTCAALTQHGIQPAFQPAYKIIRTGDFQCVINCILILRSFFIPKCNNAADRAGQQLIALRHIGKQTFPC